jgi:hypothetical protein
MLENHSHDDRRGMYTAAGVLVVLATLGALMLTFGALGHHGSSHPRHIGSPESTSGPVQPFASP